MKPNSEDESGTLQEIARLRAITEARMSQSGRTANRVPTVDELEAELEKNHEQLRRTEGSRVIWKTAAALLLIVCIYLWFSRNDAERRLADPAYNEHRAAQEAHAE